MQNTRRLRLQGVIQRELSVFVARDLKDPRVPMLTFTQVEVTADGSQATLFVSIMGGHLTESPAVMNNCLAGLSSASGFLRRHLASVLKLRHIPYLIFKEDIGFENSLRVQELLKETALSSLAQATTPATEPAAVEETATTTATSL